MDEILGYPSRLLIGSDIPELGCFLSASATILSVHVSEFRLIGIFQRLLELIYGPRAVVDGLSCTGFVVKEYAFHFLPFGPSRSITRCRVDVAFSKRPQVIWIVHY